VHVIDYVDKTSPKSKAALPPNLQLRQPTIYWLFSPLNAAIFHPRKVCTEEVK